MHDFEIPTSVWINFGLLVAAAVLVGLKLCADGPWKPARRKGRLIGKAGPA
jgi:hypothetical protein